MLPSSITNCVRTGCSGDQSSGLALPWQSDAKRRRRDNGRWVNDGLHRDMVKNENALVEGGFYQLVVGPAGQNSLDHLGDDGTACYGLFQLVLCPMTKAAPFR